MIILISKDDILDDYKKISKIGRINYIFNATESPKIRDLGNVLSDYDSASRTMSAISEAAFIIPESVYDVDIPERTVRKKLDAFFAAPEFYEVITKLVSEQILHPNNNYLIAISNKAYEKFAEKYMESFAEAFDMDSADDFIFLYDDTRGMFKYVQAQLLKKLDKIEHKLDDDDENDDLLDQRDDIIAALNDLDEADNPELSNKKAKRLVRKIFLDNAVIKKKLVKKLTDNIKTHKNRSNDPYKAYKDDEDDD